MATRLILLLAVTALCAAAQQKTVSSSTRPGVNDNASGALEGTRPEMMLKVVKDKGQVTSIDLQNRTVLFALNKAKSIELSFSQPTGLEQIKAGKKATKRIGKNRVRLEELEAGAKVRVQYYPLISQLLEVVID